MRSTAPHTGLSDVIEHLLDRGAVVLGRSTISLVGIDLIHLELQLLLSSVETLNSTDPGRTVPPTHLVPPMGDAATVPSSADATDQASSPSTASAGSVPIDLASYRDARAAEPSTLPAELPDNSKTARGLVQLVLTLVELLRQIIESQALRRVEGGSLSEEEIERVGEALKALEDKMVELRELFDLQEQDLSLDLDLLGVR